MKEVVYRLICDMSEVWDLDYWYLKWINQEKRWNGYLFIVVNLILGCLSFKKFKTFNETCSLSKTAKMSSTYLKQKLSLFSLYSLSHLDS